jgi:general secretion pathway protein I
MARSSPAASKVVAADRHAGRRRARGFTLLEVLIGLVVLSLALLALTRTAALQVDSLGQLRDRTMAGWLAQNLLAETRIASPFPPVGTSNGTRRFGPAEWRWEINVQPTQVATIRRIDVRVFSDADRKTPLAQLSGLAGEDVLP